MNLCWVKVGSFCMFMAVVLGAFGSHALRSRLDPHYMEVYKTAVLYHFIHAIGIFIVAWLSTQIHNANVTNAGISFLLGIVLFSGSLYILSVTQIKWLGAVTPFGGLCFLAGWLLLFFAK